MNFDMVHDAQKIYRKLLNCMARPGEIANISPESNKLELDSGLSNSLLALTFTVCDAEVSFNILGEHEESIIRKVHNLTYAQREKTEIADYIIIKFLAERGKIATAFGIAKKGTFIDPHASATFIIEVETLGLGSSLKLTGPGIKDSISVEISGSEDWLASRTEANAEFPLGIDVILVDLQGNIMCWPRTTQTCNLEGE